MTPTLVKIGLFEIAFAALLGWALIAHREKPGSLKRIGVIAPRKIRAADGALKQYIAHPRQSHTFMIKHHVARCVTRTVHHLHRLDPDVQHIATL